MFDFTRAFGSINTDKRVILRFWKGIYFVIDTTSEGMLVKLTDGEKPISSLIRGFKDKKELNRFMKYRFGHVINEKNKLVMAFIVPFPDRDFIKQLWEDVR